MNPETLLISTQLVFLALCFSAHLRVSKETKQNKALKKQIKELEDLQLRHVVILSETVDRMLCLENKLGARDTERDTPVAEHKTTLDLWLAELDALEEDEKVRRSLLADLP